MALRRCLHESVHSPSGLYDAGSIAAYQHDHSREQHPPASDCHRRDNPNNVVPYGGWIQANYPALFPVTPCWAGASRIPAYLCSLWTVGNPTSEDADLVGLASSSQQLKLTYKVWNSNILTLFRLIVTVLDRKQ